MSILSLLILLLGLIALVTAVVIVNRRKSQGPQHSYPPPYYQQPPGMPPYQQPQYPPQAPYAQPPPQGPPPGYQPQPQDQYVTAAGGYQLLLPQFGPNDRAIISVAVIAQGKVYLTANQNGSGVFGGGLDIVSGRRQPHEDVLTSVRRILGEATGWTGRPLATVGNATWDLGSGQENEICYAVLLDLPPNAELPAAGITTWATHADLPKLRDLGPRAQMACDFADRALSAAGV